MTYDEYERIGMDLGATYAFCKLTWEILPAILNNNPFEKSCVKFFMEEMLADMPDDVRESFIAISDLDIDPKLLESFGKIIWLSHHERH